MTKVSNAVVLAACEKMLTEGISYSQLDCQAAVEEALVRAGVPRSECNLAGSNAHYRAMLWRGTPEQCCELLGVREVPAGFFTYIVQPFGAPAKYTDDLGNADHMGVYLGGGRTFHSSQSRGAVVLSTTFNGRRGVPNGGWNMVGMAPWVDCGLTAAQMAVLTGHANYTGNDAVDELVSAGDITQAPEPVVVPGAPPQQTYVRVQTANGAGVRAREQPSSAAIYKYTVPEGTVLQVLGSKGGYYKVYYLGKARYVDQRFVVSHGMG